MQEGLSFANAPPGCVAGGSPHPPPTATAMHGALCITACARTLSSHQWLKSIVEMLALRLGRGCIHSRACTVPRLHAPSSASPIPLSPCRFFLSEPFCLNTSH